MTTTLDAARAPADAGFGHRLAPPGDPLEGAAFDDVFEAKIKPELIKCEADRKNAVWAFFLALAAGLMLVAIEVMFLPRSPSGSPSAPLILFTIIGAGVVGYLPLAMVAKKAKTSVIQALCAPLGISYSPDAGSAPAWDDFLRLRLVPHPDGKTFSDAFSGRRGQVEFSLCEATLTQGSGKQRHTVFSGQLLCLATPKRLASTTVCLRNGGWLKRFECPQGLRSVGLEDPSFNQTFAVFSTDQVEAREVLTPTFMQQLNDLEAAYAGGHIRCAFDAAQLLIALEGPNRFQIGSMFSSLVDRSRVEAIARALDQVFKLIDQFKDA